MSKKNISLGRSLIRDHKKKRVFVKDDFRHTSDLSDGLDWARLNLRSVTEQTSIDDFLAQAELAENEYSKEFETIQIIDPSTDGLLTEDEKQLIVTAHENNKDTLSVPRRPQWDITTTKEELDAMEKTTFLNWRRQLALLGEKEYISLTPYEKNLEVWRQLWRVIEKSDVVVQIVDARNPLLFRCENLERYVKEIDSRKQNILLLNKADFLAEEQRKFWAKYFEQIGVSVAFYSALQQNQKLPEIAEDKESVIPEEKSDGYSNSSEIISDDENATTKSETTNIVNDENATTKSETTNIVNDDDQERKTISNSYEVYTQEELIAFFKHLEKVNKDSNFTTIGLVGYPNVGKSSTINSILQDKKVQVSSTPGKTKHFQTFMVDAELCLCDCPGLVFPNFVSSKAEMIVNGILPIDHLTNHSTPVNLIANVLPRSVFEQTYSLILRSRSEESESHGLTADELLDAHGYMRGFMTQRGLPDHSRSARYILKDFVNGKLLYCHAPPGCNGEDYQKYTNRPCKRQMSSTMAHAPNVKATTPSEDVDRMFFRKNAGQAHVKGLKPIPGRSDNSLGKPWKKHNNRNKKEKLRRVYSDTSY